jgi:hypothetical protein
MNDFSLNHLNQPVMRLLGPKNLQRGLFFYLILKEFFHFKISRSLRIKYPKLYFIENINQE